jgi:hypothetical protein
MPVLLVCDGPNCVKQIRAVVRRGVIAAPHPWWAQTGADEAGTLIVACSAVCLNAALPQWSAITRNQAQSTEEGQA